MFNGLVREIARVKSYQNNTLSLIARHKPNLGDSIAVNGACLTVNASLYKRLCGRAFKGNAHTHSH